MSHARTHPVSAAIAAFQRGEPILVHDAADREGETDLMYPASAVDAAAVAHLRNDAGGLVCVALADEVAATFDLPFVEDIISHPLANGHDLQYDTRSSFSLTVNHRETRTGITDHDRAQTIAALAEAAHQPASFPFAETFRSPGHVHLLRAAPDLLAERVGHTELGIALADAANLPPAVALCEMLDDETGDALSPRLARGYGERIGAPYVEGADIVSALR